MCCSVFFAQLIGLYLLISSIGELIYQPRYRKLIHEAIASPMLIQVTGSMNLLFGLIILVLHHVWVAEWPIVITIIGWVLLIRGILRLFAPHVCIHFAKWLLENRGLLLTSWIEFIVGCYLVWVGFTQ